VYGHSIETSSAEEDRNIYLMYGHSIETSSAEEDRNIYLMYGHSIETSSAEEDRNIYLILMSRSVLCCVNKGLEMNCYAIQDGLPRVQGGGGRTVN
jgi:hypothetical protein